MEALQDAVVHPLSERVRQQISKTGLTARVLEQIPIVVWAVGLNGTVLLCEGGGLRVQGVSGRDVEGWPIDEVFFRPPHWRLGEAEVRRSRGCVSFRQEGTQYSTIETYTPLLSPAGRLEGTLVVCTMFSEEGQREDVSTEANRDRDPSGKASGCGAEGG